MGIWVFVGEGVVEGSIGDEEAVKVGCAGVTGSQLVSKTNPMETSMRQMLIAVSPPEVPKHLY
jgi:hypothetical protein